MLLAIDLVVALCFAVQFAVAGYFLWLLGMLAVLFGMTWAGWRRLERGDPGRYLVTALSVPALFVYLAVANVGSIVGAAFGRKTGFNRTPKTGI